MGRICTTMPLSNDHAFPRLALYSPHEGRSGHTENWEHNTCGDLPRCDVIPVSIQTPLLDHIKQGSGSFWCWQRHGPCYMIHVHRGLQQTGQRIRESTFKKTPVNTHGSTTTILSQTCNPSSHQRLMCSTTTAFQSCTIWGNYVVIASG